MTSDQSNDNLLMTVIEALSSVEGDKLRVLLETVLNAVMKVERNQALQASPVEKITEQLCGLEINSTQVSRLTKELDDEFEKFRNRHLGHFPYVIMDATYLKVRHNGTVRNQSVFIAYGVNAFGRREILGASISLSEAEVHWREFLKSLVLRGLTGVRLITSDDHTG